MGISKKCRICALLDDGNLPITADYFGKQIPQLIEKILAIELNPRKLNGVLVCQQCVIMLVHTESIIDKLRKGMLRLQKVKITRTPKKTVKTPLAKSKTLNGGEELLNGSKAETPKKSPTKTSLAKAKTDSEELLGTPKVDLDATSMLELSSLESNSIAGNEEETEFKAPVNNSKTPKTPKSPTKKALAAKQKATGLSQDKTLTQNNKDTKTEISPTKKVKTAKNQTPKKNGNLSVTTGFKKISDTPAAEVNAEANGTAVPFKKITDDQFVSQTLSSPAKHVKRKLYEDNNSEDVRDSEDSPSDGQPPAKIKQQSHTNSFQLTDEPHDMPKKRRKTNSFNDETLDNDHDFAGQKQKHMNCVLCGKKFMQKSQLREHIETSHMGEKLKECPNCFMEFRALQKYESHVFSEKCKGVLHQCQFQNCNRRFKNQYKMEAHMREKHLAPLDAVEADD